MTMRRLIRLPVVLMLVLAACLGQMSIAAAGGLNVRDDAGVLTAADQQAIRETAARAPFSVYVWTVKGGYPGNKAGFVSAADALVAGNDTVIVAVDTTDKFSHVAARNARVTSAAATAAKTAADSSFAQGQWAAGVTAAVSSLSNAAGGAPAQGGNGVPGPAASRSSFPWVGLVIFVVIVGALIAGMMALRRSRQRRSMVGPQDAAGYGPGSPGYGAPQGYGPGYGAGPGYGGGGGMGGMLAGGALGGIGGGLLGYELGKESRESQGGGQDAGYADQGQGGFVESDQGGGGADWGGGGSDF